MPGLAAGDQPVDSVEIKTFEPAEERLCRDEAHRGWHLAEVVGPSDPPLVLDRDPHPHVPWPRQERRKFGESLVALSEDLKGVVLGVAHHREDLLDELERDVRVEEVAH